MGGLIPWWWAVLTAVVAWFAAIYSDAIRDHIRPYAQRHVGLLFRRLRSLRRRREADASDGDDDDDEARWQPL